VDKEVDKSVTVFVPISERNMMINIACNKGTINLIQVYAPTADKSNEEIENFYAVIKTLIATTKRHEITMILYNYKF